MDREGVESDKGEIPCQTTAYMPMTTRQAPMKPNMIPSSWPREDMGVYGGKDSGMVDRQ